MNDGSHFEDMVTACQMLQVEDQLSLMEHKLEHL